MKFTLRHSDKLVGMFVLIGLVFLVGSLVFVGLNNRWLQSDPEYRSQFTTAEGLSTGLELQYRGFAIGRVKRVVLGTGNLVEAIFSVNSEYADRIVPGSVVELVVQPIGFGSSLTLLPGSGGGLPLAPGSLIPSTDTPRGRELLVRGLVDRPQRRDEVSTLLATLPPLIDQTDRLVGTIDRFLIRLDRTLMGAAAEPDSGLLRTVDDMLRTADTTTRQLAGHVDRTMARLEPMLESLTAFAAHLEDPEGLVATLMGGEGSAAQFFRDDARLYERLVETMAELQRLVTFLNQSAPEIGVLLDEAGGALEEGEKVLEGLKNNPLLRGGITPTTEPGSTFEGFREGGR